MTSTVTRHGPDGRQQEPEPEPTGEPRAGRSGLAWLVKLPSAGVSGLRRSAATTPGRLTLISAGLVALALLVGVVATAELGFRKSTTDDLVEHREPLTAAAQEVYRSLSDADATAAATLLNTGDEEAALQERYDTAIARAGAALAKASGDSAGIAEAADPVDVLSRQLPVYTGLVETARTNNRQGNPIGAAYLAEASELMRSEILPAAQSLYRVDAERLVDEQDTAGSIPWATALLSLGLLGALIATQVYLRRRTNRLFNVGLVVATAAVGLAVLWLAVAVTIQSILVSSGKSNGSEQADVLVRARIVALQARADETLTLLARGSGTAHEEEYRSLVSELSGSDGESGLLGQAREGTDGLPSAEHVDAAIRSASAWSDVHGQIRNLDNGGRYEEAVDLAIESDDENGATAAFTRLDGDLAKGITESRQVFVDDTTNASRALTLLAPGFGVLAVVAMFGALLGIRDRLREYR
ncbi:hypothetical protein BJF85_17315 [Saccharomonospora sp. CUA-673]|uniref:hypothetical protein n=1 Tax=Saccharomonospora sp. CUA-673 TaxID=1904969 RepID=UPI0009645CB7|nr:hypothetical protein [Saccharomonospora sp. CUA-673]OLT46379.1 hypothetical protein BJF85_17315 [Saccharomonospora sp. CUA-673]